MQNTVVIRRCCRFSPSVLRLGFAIVLLTIIIALHFDVKSLNFEKTFMKIGHDDNSLLGGYAANTEGYHISADDNFPLEGFAVYTEGCHIAELNTSVHELAEYSEKENRFHTSPPDCAKEYKYGPVLVESDATHIWIVPEALSYFNVADISELACCYRSFWRVKQKWATSKEFFEAGAATAEYSKRCTPFAQRHAVEEEFLKVECKIKGTVAHIDYHVFTPRKKFTTNNEIEYISKKHVNFSKNALNVLVFGLDSVSRANLHRRMPQTVSFLEENLKAIEMFGFNKVGDNTFPNLMPVLTGLSEKQLEKTCLKGSSNFDNCPFVWNSFSDAGYLTAFAEDYTNLGIFTHLRNGFRRQPTYYYLKIFNQVSENDIGFGNSISNRQCMGPRKDLHTMISHASKFYVSMKEIPKFSFYWSASATHEAVSYAKWIDSDIREFFRDITERGVLNDTIIFFISDHGLRWGEVRKTYQGFLEERLPFMYVIFPDRFKKKYALAYSNLKQNARRLVTPFDLHEALSDLANVKLLEDDEVTRRAEELERSSLPRGISLFLPIPGSRTCADAGIANHWCTCHERSDVPVDSAEARTAAIHVVDHINTLLRHSPQCADLKLKTILSAREEKSFTQEGTVMSDTFIRDLLVTLETTPGAAVLEATVRTDGLSKRSKLLGSVSRLNVYGNSSECVHDAKLQLYCFCTH